MKIHWTAAALVVALAPATALAGFVSGASATDAFTGVAPGAPDYTSFVPVDGTQAGADDGLLVFDLRSESGAGLVQTVGFFAAAQTSLQLSIFTGGVSGAYLAGVNFEQAGGGAPSALWSAALPSDGALLADTVNLFTFDLTGATPYSLTPQGGFGPGSTYTQVSLLFAFDVPGDRLALDAIANGEVAGTPVAPLPSAVWTGIPALTVVALASLFVRRRRRARLLV